MEDGGPGKASLEKFRITAEHKEAFKRGVLETLDRQFETLEETYLEIFKGLPYEVVEAMTPREAAGYVDLVVKAAVNNLTKGSEAMRKEMLELLKDKDKMDGIRSAFIAGFNGKSETSADDIGGKNE